MTTDVYNIFNGNDMMSTMFKMSLMPEATGVAKKTLEAQEAQAVAMAFLAKKNVCDSLDIELPEDVKTKILQELGLMDAKPKDTSNAPVKA